MRSSQRSRLRCCGNSTHCSIDVEILCRLYGTVRADGSADSWPSSHSIVFRGSDEKNALLQSDGEAFERVEDSQYGIGGFS